MKKLFDAIKTGNFEQVKSILSDNNLDINKVTDKDGKTPLYVACENSDLFTIETIIKSSRYSHKPNFLGIVKLLLSKGAKPDEKNYDGNTPLWQASLNGNFEIVELLLSKGADPDKENKYSFTPKTIAERMKSNTIDDSLSLSNKFNETRLENFKKIVKILKNPKAEPASAPATKAEELEARVDRDFRIAKGNAESAKANLEREQKIQRRKLGQRLLEKKLEKLTKQKLLEEKLNKQTLPPKLPPRKPKGGRKRKRRRKTKKRRKSRKPRKPRKSRKSRKKGKKSRKSRRKHK